MKTNKKLKQKSQETVKYLINTLEKEGLKPVIARNYENYPNFAHDLDLFISGDLKSANLIFIKVAEILEWEILTICNHYSNFETEEFNIYTYRFYHLENLQTLSVDLFGGLNIFGQSLIDKYQICENRKLEPRKRFFTMRPDWENGYRIFQIANLNYKNNKEKIERYRKKVLDFQDKNPGALEAWGRNSKLGDLSIAVKSLKSRNFKKLKNTIMQSKLKFVFSNFLKDPINTIKKLIDRKRGLDIQFKTNPCGPYICLSGDNKKIRKELNNLVENGFLIGWSEKEDLRERGWALINFKKKSNKKINFKDLVNQVIYRHKVIYSSNKTS